MAKELRIVICDDESTAISIISATVEALLSSRSVPVRIEKFTSARRCLAWASGNPADLIFLDISMPEADGIELARKLLAAARDGRPDIIFVSSRQERVFDTFEIQPFGFVRKDHFMNDISSVLTRYIETRISEKKNDRWLEVQSTKGIQMLSAERVNYIESFRNTQTIYLTDADPVTIRSTMDAILEKVENWDFIRIHKGYIVGCQNIKNFTRTEVILSSGERLPVGRSYYHDAVEKYMNYIRLHGAIGI